MPNIVTRSLKNSCDEAKPSKKIHISHIKIHVKKQILTLTIILYWRG